MTSEYQKDLQHREKLRRKVEKLRTLRDLLQTHEESGAQPDDEYLTGLRHRIHSTQTQLEAMGGF